MNKKFLQIGLFILVWVMGFVFLTRMVTLFSNRTASKTDIPLQSADYQKVIFAVEKIVLEGELFQDYRAKGWAFIEYEGESTDKEIYLVFASEKHQYIFQLRTHNRLDLNEAASLSEYKIPKYKNGFDDSFSTLLMKNGTYKLYLYVKENATLFGIQDTGRVFLKKEKSFEQIKP